MAKTKMRGTSTAPIVLGIVGGALNLPFALCAGACAAGVGSISDDATADAMGNTYLIMVIIAGIIAIIFACMAKKYPKLAGIMLIMSTIISGLLYCSSLYWFGFIPTILTLIGAILCFTQKKEPVDDDSEQ